MLNKFKNKFFISFSAGALCALAFAPFHFFIAAIISISSFYYFLEEKSNNKKEAFYLGLSYGYGYFLAGIYWISISLLVDAASFAWLIPLALTIIPAGLALYFALLAYCFKAVNQKFLLKYNFQKILLFILLWLLSEVIRSFLFTGFAWNLIGYSLFFSDNLVQFSSIQGIYGLSIIALLLALLPIIFIKSDKILASIIILITAAIFCYGHFRLKNTQLQQNPTKTIRLIQGNIAQEMKWDNEVKYKNLQQHINLSNQANNQNISAVIWSETAIPYIIDGNKDLLKELNKAIPDNATLIAGAVRAEYMDNGYFKNVWNSVFAINKNGVIDYYDKHHLVPFGEYVPYQKYLPFIEKITGGGVGFSEGAGPKTIKTANFSFAPFVCYEAIFSDKIVDNSSRSDLLVNLTNDAWFGNSSGPYQHFDMTRMRAIEQGIALARVANTGITAYFDPLGNVTAKIALNQAGYIDVNLIKALDFTIFSKYQYWPLTLEIALLLLFLIITIYYNEKTHSKSNRSHNRS